MDSIHFSSDSGQWDTPQWLVEEISTFLGGIYLDPCVEDSSNPNTGATVSYQESEDGLAQEWVAGTMFMNPPYGRGISRWVNKAVEAYESWNVKTAILLLPARLDTAWWRKLSPYYFIVFDGRLKFGQATASAPFPSALFYLGSEGEAKIFAQTFGKYGSLYKRIKVL